MLLQCKCFGFSPLTGHTEWHSIWGQAGTKKPLGTPPSQTSPGASPRRPALEDQTIFQSKAAFLKPSQDTHLWCPVRFSKIRRHADQFESEWLPAPPSWTVNDKLIFLQVPDPQWHLDPNHTRSAKPGGAGGQIWLAVNGCESAKMFSSMCFCDSVNCAVNKEGWIRCLSGQ